MPRLLRVQNMPESLLNMPDYIWICLNMPGKARICLNLPEWIFVLYFPISPLVLQFLF